MQEKSLTIRTKLLFSTGDLTASLTLALQTFFQLYFLTDVARLPPATVGWILGITRLWDSINDPLIGLISDRIKSRYGRRRVLLIYGSVPLGVLFMLCWFVPPWGPTALAIYFTLIIIAFDTAFTIVHVGFNALTPAMTSDYDERSSLNGYRMAFNLSGTLIAILFATILANFIHSEQVRFATMGLVLGLIAIIPPWIVFAVSRHADPVTDVSHMSLMTALTTTIKNRAFVFLTCLYLASWTATSILAATLIYYANYNLRLPDEANYFVLLAQGGAVFSIPICVGLAKYWDKPRAFLLGIGGWVILLTLFFAWPNPDATMVYAFALLCGPGIATAAVIPWSMLPDVIEAEEALSGERREGAYYSFAAFFQILGIGIALWSIGQALGSVGYITPTDSDPLPQQPAETLAMIRFIIGPITIGLLAISLPFAWFYPINRSRHQQTLAKLARSRSA